MLCNCIGFLTIWLVYVLALVSARKAESRIRELSKKYSKVFMMILLIHMEMAVVILYYAMSSAITSSDARYYGIRSLFLPFLLMVMWRLAYKTSAAVVYYDIKARKNSCNYRGELLPGEANWCVVICLIAVAIIGVGYCIRNRNIVYLDFVTTPIIVGVSAFFPIHTVQLARSFKDVFVRIKPDFEVEDKKGVFGVAVCVVPLLMLVIFSSYEVIANAVDQFLKGFVVGGVCFWLYAFIIMKRGFFIIRRKRYFELAKNKSISK